MSLDNVIAVAAAAKWQRSTADLRTCEQHSIDRRRGGPDLLALLDRLPVLLWAGAALLGWIAGDVIATDPAIHPKLQPICDGVVGVELDALLACWVWRRSLSERRRNCLRDVGRRHRADRGSIWRSRQTCPRRTGDIKGAAGLQLWTTIVNA